MLQNSRVTAFTVFELSNCGEGGGGKMTPSRTQIRVKGKTLTEYTNLFLANNFKENDDIILNYFMSNS